ncbi:protein STRUBBELIG-RECEPTOR FAMILY 3-like [Impatiens glandulifera]|uniref:protein STRUBBELIG-RECEPTOR FAMILY 3-like n=1 Tax=Impatiens glandulifera TaxID=253017 RepID=UPI001FB0FD1F|nr:protein STRUBBELIG-RECEPTOR FAMILY 3-like [Impatiens glandulifera]
MYLHVSETNSMVFIREMSYVKWVMVWLIVGFWITSSSHGLTHPSDVFAINGLYAALGFPILPGWISFGGDPCVDAWQGVQCVDSNITQIVLSGVNLRGQLGESLQNFASIIQLDLSNNSIGGGIPSSLPITIRNFYLSGNQLTGNIPTSLSLLGQLTDLSFSSNKLTGPIPDAFQRLTNLINLDLSGNNLSNQLPPSMANLSSLVTLHLQNNQLNGRLDVLQDLSLKDLNVENNMFTGPVPPKLLNIPNFRSGGNPFNKTVIPSSPSPSPFLSPPRVPSPDIGSGGPKNRPSTDSAPKTPNSKNGKRFLKTKRGVLIIVGGILAVAAIISLGLFLFICRSKRRQITNKIDKSSDFISKQKEDHHSIDHVSNVEDSLRVEKTNKETTKNLNSVRTFTVATLQQYSDSFSQENLIGRGLLGSVYSAKLPTGEILAVKKLDTTNTICGSLSEERFLELACSVSKLRHGNVAEMMGYCVEHGQRLLVYKYYQNGTIHEALYSNENLHKSLSWNTRIRLALGSSRALEYLHEVCEPPIVHQNFKSSNILLDDQLAVHVSDCGLAPIWPPESLKQLMNDGYGAPEVELGAYTCKSDVYSFGILMLELLTGRKSCDRSRARGEQFLVRWAIPQLHDIDALSKMVDPSLNGAYPSKSLSRFADIISLCVQPEPEFRPLMSEIVESLLHLI